MARETNKGSEFQVLVTVTSSSLLEEALKDLHNHIQDIKELRDQQWKDQLLDRLDEVTMSMKFALK